ncbi:MAG TPA: hypothetical protein VK506_06175 [Conexibacter sp.]|nr:hypothetical protein [Conexibacter sp.]
MRRTLLLVVGLLTLALAVPTVTSAHGGGHHGKHKKWKKAHRSFVPGGTAGTVTSFENGVLTITLNNGSTVSGAVDDDTFIGCVTAAAPPAPTVARRSNSGHRGWGGWEDDDHDWGDGHRRCGKWSDCDEEDLVPGATVWKAKLEIDEDGAEWEKVKLIVQAPPPSDT